jgi:hypothetical protein
MGGPSAQDNWWPRGCRSRSFWCGLGWMVCPWRNPSFSWSFPLLSETTGITGADMAYSWCSGGLITEEQDQYASLCKAQQGKEGSGKEGRGTCGWSIRESARCVFVCAPACIINRTPNQHAIQTSPAMASLVHSLLLACRTTLPQPQGIISPSQFAQGSFGSTWCACVFFFF